MNAHELGLRAIVLLSLASPLHAAVTLSVGPTPQYIEEGQGRRYLNFDIVARNEGTRPVKLTEVKLTVRDAHGKPALERFINGNGINIVLEDDTLGRLAVGEATTYFNPFHDFPADMPLDRLAYSFRFQEEGAGGQEIVREVVVNPSPYAGKAKLRLPLRGALLSYDAHDFYSHHRRTDLTSSFLRKVGITSNAARYSFDFSIVDTQGRQFRGDGKKNSDWYSWEQPVLAPASGRVVALANDRKDQDIAKPDFEFPGPPYDPTLINGNYIVIDHGGGEHSLLAHMRQGSVKLRVGDAVRAGDVVGLVGFSGAVITIHTHYQLQTGAAYNSEGLPAYFHDFERLRGDRTIKVGKGAVDTGEIIRSAR